MDRLPGHSFRVPETDTKPCIAGPDEGTHPRGIRKPGGGIDEKRARWALCPGHDEAWWNVEDVGDVGDTRESTGYERWFPSERCLGTTRRVRGSSCLWRRCSWAIGRRRIPRLLQYQAHRTTCPCPTKTERSGDLSLSIFDLRPPCSRHIASTCTQSTRLLAVEEASNARARDLQ